MLQPLWRGYRKVNDRVDLRPEQRELYYKDMRRAVMGRFSSAPLRTILRWGGRVKGTRCRRSEKKMAAWRKIGREEGHRGICEDGWYRKRRVRCWNNDLDR